MPHTVMDLCDPWIALLVLVSPILLPLCVKGALLAAWVWLKIFWVAFRFDTVAWLSRMTQDLLGEYTGLGTEAGVASHDAPHFLAHDAACTSAHNAARTTAHDTAHNEAAGTYRGTPADVILDVAHALGNGQISADSIVTIATALSSNV